MTSITPAQVSDTLAQTLNKFSLVAADVAETVGMNQFELSRLRTGKKDVHSTLMFQILTALPNEARMFFLLKLGIFDLSDRSTDLSSVLRDLKSGWMIAETDPDFCQN
jgi:hypothetical protein